jgi:hypothetical protein
MVEILFHADLFVIIAKFLTTKDHQAEAQSCTQGRAALEVLLAPTRKAIKFAGADKVCAYAAVKGNLTLLTALHQAGLPWDKKTTYAAAACGSLPCLKYAFENGVLIDIETTYAAASCGEIEVDPADGKITQQSSHAFFTVADHEHLPAGDKPNHLACLKFCIENGCKHDVQLLSNMCCRMNDMAMLKYVYALHGQLPVVFTQGAAQWNRIKMLEFARLHGEPLSIYLGHIAGLYGNLEVLEYLHKHDVAMSAQTMMMAVAQCHTECAQFLFSKGYRVPAGKDCSSCMSQQVPAARRLATVQFLHEEHGLVLDHNTTVAAGLADDDAVLEYAFHQMQHDGTESRRSALEMLRIQCKTMGAERCLALLERMILEEAAAA